MNLGEQEWPNASTEQDSSPEPGPPYYGTTQATTPVGGRLKNRDSLVQQPTELKALAFNFVGQRTACKRATEGNKSPLSAGSSTRSVRQTQKVKRMVLFSSEEFSRQHGKWPSPAFSSSPHPGLQRKVFPLRGPLHVLCCWAPGETTVLSQVLRHTTILPSSWAATGITCAHGAQKSYLTQYISLKHKAERSCKALFQPEKDEICFLSHRLPSGKRPK